LTESQRATQAYPSRLQPGDLASSFSSWRRRLGRTLCVRRAA
jgi:hypothetical protein